ncbi:hypothetical protein FB45DRAFT_880609 [Roridomyces roridus]|uniref:Uncharacterized protein n=1 Tax=Roridomyces roridus TaxID=1738132 RepID=A0AAD7AYL5_9AGAR|nr:hypothetical protein FB45DRAFT_880609 [Roridomyces roridus]
MKMSPEHLRRALAGTTDLTVNLKIERAACKALRQQVQQLQKDKIQLQKDKIADATLDIREKAIANREQDFKERVERVVQREKDVKKRESAVSEKERRASADSSKKRKSDDGKANKRPSTTSSKEERDRTSAILRARLFGGEKDAGHLKHMVQSYKAANIYKPREPLRPLPANASGSREAQKPAAAKSVIKAPNVGLQASPLATRVIV